MKVEKTLPRVGISIGDINGIGPEVVLKTFEDERMLEFCTPIIFAHTKMLSFLSRHFNLSTKIQGIANASKAIPSKINVVNIEQNNPKINFGKEDKAIGAYAVKSLKAATHAIKNRQIDVLVTAPIHKNSIQVHIIFRIHIE